LDSKIHTRNIFVPIVHTAKIYYTFASQNVTDIQGWDNAYYMAPMTGAVLSKVLDYILDYTMHHPRYQPFVVRSTNVTHMQNNISSAGHSSKSSHHDHGASSAKDLIVLESSNSDDFVWNVIDQLALLYVDIDPLLTPNRYILELYVADAQRDIQYLSSYSMTQEHEEVEGEELPHPTNVAYAAASFYDKLYTCIRAEQTGDYSAFIPVTHSPTYSPTMARFPTGKPTYPPTNPPSLVPTHLPSYPPTYLPSSSPFSTSTLSSTNASTVSPAPSSSPSFMSPTVAYPTSLPTTYRPTISPSPTTFQPSSSTGELGTDDVNWHRRKPPERKQLTYNRNKSRSLLLLKKLSKKVIQRGDRPWLGKESGVVQYSYSQHLRRESSSKIDPSSSDKDSARSTTAIISTCLSDPKYGIRRLAVLETNSSDLNTTHPSGTNHSSTTHVYLFMDGAHYLRINATEPFLAIVPSPLAIAQVKPIPEAKWDIIDWLIVLMIVYGFFYGIISILDYIGLVDMQTCCVRWKKAKAAYAHARAASFHDDNNPEDDPGDGEMEDDGEVDDAVPGSYIPSSMGGWRRYSPRHPTRLFFASSKRSTPTKYQRYPLLNGSASIEDEESIYDDTLPNVEGRSNVLPDNNIDGYEGSNFVARPLQVDRSPRSPREDVTRTRKMIHRPPKDPESVDIPDLTFSSPIAVPASASRSPLAAEASTSNGIMA